MGTLIDSSMRDALLNRARAASMSALVRGDKTRDEMIRDGELIPYHPYRSVVSGDGIGMGAIWADRTNESILAHIGKERASHIVRNMVKTLREGKSLVLSGPTGTGKTSLAVIAYRLFTQTLVADSTNYFVRWPTFLARLCAGDWNAGTDLALSVSKASGLVVIDDFASAALSGTENKRKLEYAEAIVFSRYDAGAPTIYTTNRNMDGIASQLGDRIASRLSENTVEFYIGGNDLRRQPK